MQQGVGPAERLQHLRPPGQLVAEAVEPGQQAVAHFALPRRRLDARRGHAFENGDGVAHVGGEERGAEVAAEVAASRQQRVAGRAGMELGDEIHDRPHATGLRVCRLHRPAPQVFVSMPHPLPAPISRRREQLRAAVAQPEGRKPTPRHQLVALREPGIETLEHERARPAVGPDGQPIDSGLQALELDGAAARAGVGEGFREGVAQLGRAGLVGGGDGVKQRRAQSVHTTLPSSRTASVSRPLNIRSHDMGRLRYRAESYASSGLAQRIAAS